MALCDYILCAECECKLIYDGTDTTREWLEERFGDPTDSDYTVRLLCPNCQKKQEEEITILRSRIEQRDAQNALMQASSSEKLAASRAQVKVLMETIALAGIPLEVIARARVDQLSDELRSAVLEGLNAIHNVLAATKGINHDSID